MFYHIRGMLCLTGRVLLCTIFLLSAVGNKIPNYGAVVDYMAQNGVPEPRTALAGAIGFLIVGSLSVIFGFFARLGAFMLLIFLVAATYYFHGFWRFEDAAARRDQMIQFMKNLSMMGAMLLVMAQGAGPWSLDAKRVRD